MKTLLQVQIICICFMCTCAFLACEKDNKKIQIQNFTFSACKNDIKSTSDDNNNEHIKFQAEDNSTIKVSQILFLNCCFENIQTESKLENNIIVIDEIDSGIECNCICPVEINFEVTGLSVNQIYKFIIKRNNQDYSTHDVLFTVTTDVLYPITNP